MSAGQAILTTCLLRAPFMINVLMRVNLHLKDDSISWPLVWAPSPCLFSRPLGPCPSRPSSYAICLPTCSHISLPHTISLPAQSGQPGTLAKSLLTGETDLPTVSGAPSVCLQLSSSSYLASNDIPSQSIIEPS